MAAADRLSALDDDLLEHILSFAPAKEAAASAALSRRWRPLWRCANALNLDSRPYSSGAGGFHYPDARFDAFFRDGKAALARRRGTALKRLTVFLKEGAYLTRRGSYYRVHDVEPEHDARVAGLLADPAAAALEELRIAGEHAYSGLYIPPLASLPCATATLRVLELHFCCLQPPPTSSARLAFPRLTDLSLRDCTYLEGYLQVVIDAATALTRLALVNVTNKPPKRPDSAEDSYSRPSKPSYLPLCLRCRTVTALVLVTSVSLEEQQDSRDIGIQLDMPSLRSFRYKGFPVKLSLTSPAPGLARVDLDTNRRERNFYKREPAARMLASFSSTKALKLHITGIEEIVSGDEAILPTFPNLKLLEIDGNFKYMDIDAALAVATLLRACPAMSELRLRLNMAYDYDYDRKMQEPARRSFAQSVERFSRLASMCSQHHDDVEFGGVSELPDAFTDNCEFSCQRTSLRKVKLQFKSKEINCFQVQLAKFLVENAMVLEEMHIEDESQFWPDHLCHKVARWRADALRRRNLPDTAGFRVYQLANPAVDPQSKANFVRN
ncbi:F-box domain containing protein [Hordeum vulgare]|nr:F-box domain containing protein [Hordeum vulgare]